MGRPRKFNRIRIATISFPAEVLEALTLIAKKEGIPLSELVRRVVMDWLENEAKIKYGIVNLFAEQPQQAILARRGGLSSSPLTQDKLVEITSALDELEPKTREAVETIKRVYEEYQKLEKEKSEARSRIKGDMIYEYKGRSVKGWEILRELEDEWRKRERELRGEFFQADSTIRRFFSKVYYPYESIQKSLDRETAYYLENRIALERRKVNLVQDIRFELRRAFTRPKKAYTSRAR